MSRRRSRANEPPAPEKVEDAFSTETLNQLAEERMRDIEQIVYVLGMTRPNVYELCTLPVKYLTGTFAPCPAAVTTRTDPRVRRPRYLPTELRQPFARALEGLNPDTMPRRVTLLAPPAPAGPEAPVAMYLPTTAISASFVRPDKSRRSHAAASPTRARFL